jgi:prepilin-type N-terminal cleavage/methylation domain-containing protein/prepilin-type processing-associated H-X9-DG protein
MCQRFDVARGHAARSERTAVTLVELLVVIVVISILMAILFPAIHGARESARQSTCRNNLRQFAVGLNQYASKSRGQLCSGAFDWLADGCVTEIGWVADLVDQDIPVGKMLCPSNPAQLAATFNDLLTGDASASACVNKRGQRPNNPCAKIMDTTGTRAAVVQDEILAKNYNTNYAASWFLVRSSVLLDSSGNFAVHPAGCPAGVKSRNSTAGPLSVAYAESSRTPMSFLPILACGAVASNPLSSGVAAYPAGAKLAVSFTGGPVKQADASEITSADLPKPRAWWDPSTLQDYRGFAPVHRGSCNVLFADGRVDALVDRSNDGLINNGFPAGAGGFTSDMREVEPGDLYSHWMLGIR